MPLASTAKAVEPQPIRVMIVDDHKAILWGLERLVESAHPRLQSIATASSCSEMLRVAADCQPDVIVLDLDLNGTNSLASLPELRRSCQAQVLILTGDRDPAMHQAAIIAGARGVVLKDEGADVVLQAIEHVHAAQFWASPLIAGGMVGMLASRATPDALAGKSRIASLTAREREIIRAIVRNRGAKSIVIAEALAISEHTLRNHLTAIYDKLGLRNRIDLFAFATEHDLDRG